MSVLQHDLFFAQEINHTAIVKSMYEYPNILRIIWFNKNAMNGGLPCLAYNSNGTTLVDHVNNASFHLLMKWSDK